MKNIMKEIRTSIIAIAFLAILLCGFYPVLVWLAAESIFPYQANGSLIIRNEKIIGSFLLAQRFYSAEYFHPRPSSAGSGFDTLNSGGSNLGPLSKTLIEGVKRRAQNFRNENGLAPNARIPADAVLASGSGLDPHISLENAWLQVPRVAHERNLTQESLRKMIATCTEGRWIGIFGEPRVNILCLNLNLCEETGK